MEIQRFDPSDSIDEVAAAVQKDGAAIIGGLASPESMDRVDREITPWLEAVVRGGDASLGRRTRRLGGLIARSPTARELINQPMVLRIVREVVHLPTTIQLHLTQVIAIGPGETGQAIHRDQWAFDFFPFPKGYEIQCNTIWAMTDFTEENGATRVVVGSSTAEDRLEFRLEDTQAAEMEKGSLLFYTGSVYHGGGPNQSDATRFGLNLTYVVAWLRQEENQYLSVPREIAMELPESLLRLMGYAQGAYALGYIDDLRDPIEAVRPEFSRTRGGFGDLEQAQETLRQKP